MNIWNKAVLGAAFLFGWSCQPASNSGTNPEHIFIGNYTRDEGWVNGKGDGIYLADLSNDGSNIVVADTTGEIINPTFLALSPDRKNLYSVSEIMPGDDETGYVYAYAIEDDLSLRLLNHLPSNGLAPAHISVDQSGSLVFASNYMGGVVSVYERLGDGSIKLLQTLQHEGSGPHQNQDGSHVHMAKVSPDNQYLYVPDLGADKIWSYRIDQEQKEISPTQQEWISLPPGSGPRHMEFHPNGTYVYAINELNSTISFYKYQAKDGSLFDMQYITTLPEGFDEWNSTADIHVHPNGKFLYASNRGHNSLAAFSLDENGEMSVIGHTSTRGEIPRNFAIHPSGDFLYVANQNTDNIEIFAIDTETGELTHSGNTLEVPTPVCILFY